jgi:hypothetical protein
MGVDKAEEPHERGLIGVSTPHGFRFHPLFTWFAATTCVG